MAYSPTVWKNGDLITAEALNHLEQGFSEISAEQVSFETGNMQAKNVRDAMNELFTSVSEGKNLLASAITDRGVETKADAGFQTMREHILAIPAWEGVPEGMRTIVVSSGDPNGGQVSGGGMAQDGMKVTVSAEPGEGYGFLGWFRGDSVVSGDKEYSFIVSENASLEARFKREREIFPGGYAAVEYVFVTGRDDGCYVDTGYKLAAVFGQKAGLRAVIDVETTEDSGTAGYFAGSLYSYNSTVLRQTVYQQFYLGVNASGIAACGGSAFGAAPEAVVLSGDTTPRRMLLELDAKRQVAAIDGNEVTIPLDNADNSEKTFYLLGANGVSGGRIPAKWYGAKVYSDDVLVRDYVPCRSEDGTETGFFDRVSGTFFPGQGDGTLVCGEEL